MKNNLIVLLFILIFSGNLKSQNILMSRNSAINLPNYDEAWIHFGFLIGLHSSYYRINYSEKSPWRRRRYRLERRAARGACVRIRNHSTKRWRCWKLSAGSCSSSFCSSSSRRDWRPIRRCGTRLWSLRRRQKVAGCSIDYTKWRSNSATDSSARRTARCASTILRVSDATRLFSTSITM